MGGRSGDTMSRRNTGAFPGHAGMELEGQCLHAVKIAEGSSG